MYQTTDLFGHEEYQGLQFSKITPSNPEIICISLEKDAIFKKHVSPADVHLVMLEGSIDFYINNTSYTLHAQQLFKFPKDTEHWVKARDNSKFLILR